MSSDEESINNDRVISVEDEDNNTLEVGDELQDNEGITEEVQRDETADGDGEANGDQDGNRTTVKPKRVIRNPIPKLNAEKLQGPRGIAALDSYFERVKFKGKGYEHQDLNVIMKTYEYWCHRLFPKFPFDTCIERIEKLGTKRAVQTHIKRIRFDLLVEDKPIIDSSDEEANVEGFVDIQNDEINQQNQQFDQLLSTSLPSTNEQPIELTEEQLEKIRLSKERAEKLRQERLRKIRDKAKENLEVPSQLPGTSGLDNEGELFPDSSQNSNFSEEPREKSFEEPTFDLESNVKGKATVSGSTVKKKSSKKNEPKDVTDENSTESISFLKLLRNNNRLFDSDESAEEGKEQPSQQNNQKMRSNRPNEIDVAAFLNGKSRHRNIIESDGSDQEVEDNSGKSTEVSGRRHGDSGNEQTSQQNNGKLSPTRPTSPNERNIEMDNDTDVSTLLNGESRHKNIIETDESDQGMEDTSGKSREISGRRHRRSQGNIQKLSPTRPKSLNEMNVETDNDTGVAALLNGKSRHRNIIETDESDQEMEDNSGKSAEVSDRRCSNSQQSPNEINIEMDNDDDVAALLVGKSRHRNIIETDESNQEKEYNVGKKHGRI